WTCEAPNLLYHSCHGTEAPLSRGGGDRPREARRVPGGHPQALLRRADRRGADRLRRAPRALADDARVRRRPRDDRAPADRDRALRLVERGEARGRARAAALRDEGGAA